MNLVVFNNGKYSTNTIAQWSLNQKLKIYGLNLPESPEIHFSNDLMDKAIRKECTVEEGAILVDIPNSLLQEAKDVIVYVCSREYESFVTIATAHIPVKARRRPEDYILDATTDKEVYSFEAIENLVSKSVGDMTKTCNDTLQAVKTDNASTLEGVKSSNASTLKSIQDSNAQSLKDIKADNDATVKEIQDSNALVTQKVDEYNAGLYNPNLLINSNFMDPINQRGKLEYTDAGYSVDRWGHSVNTKVTVENGFMRTTVINDTSVDCLLYQLVDIPETLIPVNMVLTVKIRSSVKGKFMVYGTDRYFEVNTDWNVLSIPFVKSEIDKFIESKSAFPVWLGFKDYNKPGVGIIPNGAYFDVEYAKLEVGKVSTVYVPKSHTRELLDCRRYYKTVPLYNVIMSSDKTGKNLYIADRDDTELRIKTPKIYPGQISCTSRFDKLDIINQVLSGFNISTINSAYLINMTVETPVGSSSQGWVFNPSDDIHLDAEIYWED